MAVLGLGVGMADFAHRWIKVVLLALLGLTAMDQRALAFTAANNTVSQVSLGTCFVQRLVNTSSGYAATTIASGGIGIGDPGGLNWNNSAVNAGNVITKQMIATCLGTPLSNVAGLRQNGADGTYATDPYLGFAFRLTAAAGGMSAGWTEFAVGTGSQIPADITPPTLSAVVATTALRIGTTSLVTFTFSEPVTGFSNSNLTVPNGTLSTVTSADSGKTWTATLTPTGSVTAATNGIVIPMNGVSDSSENAATGTVNSNNYAVDTVAPTVTSVTSAATNKAYKAADKITVQVIFSEAVTVTGTPQLTLKLGATTRIVNIDAVSGSGTTTLNFSYTVVAGDTSADLDYASTTALALGTGTIKDSSGNAATLTLAAPGAAGSLGANKAIVIDTTAPTVSSVTSTKADGTYRNGTVVVQVVFSENVTVTGTPALVLWTGSARTVYVSSGSGTATLTFGAMSINAGDNTGDLDYQSTSSLFLNLGSIADAAGNNAVLTLPAPGAAGSLGANKAIVIDTIAPVVTSVTSSTADGTYKVGSVINLQVGFSEGVIVIGTPQLTLNLGATNRTVNYKSGTGSGTLTFSYTVQAGDTSADLDYVSATSLAGTITDLATNAATLTLPTPGAAGSLGANKAIVIDTIAPVVTSVTSSTADGAYTVGSVIHLQLGFSEAVSVTGTPQLTLKTGATNQLANYTSGTGTATLTFTYTVQAGDTSADLDYVSATSLAGTITDLATNAATLTLPTPGAAGSLGANKAIVIDTTAPTVTSVSSSIANGPYGLGSSLALQVTFSEAVTVTGTPQLTLETGTIDRVVNFAAGSGSPTLSFIYTVQSGDIAAVLDYTSTEALAPNAGTLVDMAGNPATLTLPAPGTTGSLGVNKSIGIDAFSPTVTSVSGPAGGIYRLGQNLDFLVNVSEPVTITGSPSLSVTVGAAARSAMFVSASQSTALLFRYTVASGDLDLDGISISNLVLNGATLKDSVGNDLALTLIATDPTPGVVVDAVPPVLSGLSPNAGNIAGGTTVAISGSGFSAASAVQFGAVPATSFVINSATLITATLPLGTLGAADVTVTTPNGSSATGVASQFTYFTIADAPTMGAATAGDGQASVSFTAPSSDGGAEITLYSVTSSPEGLTSTGSASPLVVAGLSNGTAYTFTVTATNAAGTGPASAASNAVTPNASQTISFPNPGAQAFGSTPTLTATATSGLAVSFSAQTPVCTVTAEGVLTFVATGSCTIRADQAGNASIAAASSVSQTFDVTAVMPDAPTMGAATAGDGQASVSFTAPSSDGGAEITLYSVTSSPEGLTSTGSASPLVVAGLSNGTAYTFTVTAANAAGTGPASSASNTVTPSGTNIPPIAEAGDAQIVVSGAEVMLDAESSLDPDGEIEAIVWAQTAGTSVELSSETVPQPTFIAPVLDAGTDPVTLIFALTVYDGTTQSSTDTVSVTVEPPVVGPGTKFAEKTRDIKDTLTATATLGLSSTLSADQSMVQAAKTRFLSKADQAVAFDVDGSFAVNPISLSSMGTFYGQTARREGVRRLVFGNFDLQQKDGSGAETATLNGKIAWEWTMSQTSLVGAFIGADVAQSTLAGSFWGEQTRLSLSIGSYGVHEVAKQLYLDGFASLSAGRNILSMRDESLTLDSTYATRSARFGLAVSGVISAPLYELWPEIALTFGRTWIDTAAFSGTADGITQDDLRIEGDDVTLSNLTLRPEVRIALDGGSVAQSTKIVTYSPRLICQRANQKTSCGSGVEFGVQTRSADGLTTLKAQVSTDWIDGQVRSNGHLNIEIRF